MTVATAQGIQFLNLAYFGRPADPASLSAWPSSELSLEAIVLQFTGTAEYSTNTVEPNSALNPGGGRTFNDTNLINTFYQRLFGRLATSAEVAGWADALARGAVNYDYLGITILQAGLNLPAGTEMREVLIAKFDSNQLYTGILFNNPVDAAAYSTAAAIQSGIAFSASNSTATPATSAQAQTAVNQMVAGSGAAGGQSFTLTTAADTATAARFVSDIAIVGNFALNTLNNGDRLTGSGTNTSLSATLNTTGGINIAPTLLSNIQTASFELTQIGGAAGTTTLDFSNSTGLLNVSTNTAGAAFTINNLGAALSRVAVSNTTFAHTFAFADAALAGATDAITVAANNFTTGVALNLNVATGGASAYETVSIESLGSAVNVFNVVTNGAGYTTLNVSGAAGLTTTNASANLTVFNAATATGAITYTQGGEGAASYTGGSGNDDFILNGTYTNADTINGGDGADRLTLTFAIANGVSTAQANITNIETIGLSDALAGAVSVNLFGGATGLRFGAVGGTGTVNYAAGTNALDFQNFDIAGGNLTVNVAGVATTDVLNVTKGSTAAGSNFAANNVTTNGAETVNILSQGGANTFQGLLLTDTAATESVVITGNQAIVFAGAVRADAVNASGMTGAATLSMAAGTGTTSTNITGTANNDTIAGSTAADIIAGGGGNDVIANVITGTNATAADVLTGGGGFDTFVLRGDQASAAGGLAGQYSAVAQVTDFVTGSTTTTTDILQLSATIGNYGGGGAFFAGVAAAAAGATGIQSVAQNAAAAAIVAGTDLVKLTTGIATGGLTAQTAFNAAIGTATVTGFTAADDIFVAFYDTTNSRMVVGLADTGAGNTVLGTGDAFTVIGSLAMSATDYASFANTNLSIIAA